METKACPKCGAELANDGKYVILYTCGTLVNKEGGMLQRTSCKDRQIARLTDLLKDAHACVKMANQYGAGMELLDQEIRRVLKNG